MHTGHFNTYKNGASLEVIFVPKGPVVQSIVNLVSLLRGQLVKYFTTSLLNTLQKLLTFFQQKILANSRY